MHFWGFGVPGLCRGTGHLQPETSICLAGPSGQVPSRVRRGPVQIRHVLCFTAFRTHPGPEVGPIPVCPGPERCDPSDHLQESPGPPGPKSQKSLKKSLFGGLQKSPRKYPKKTKNTQNWTFLGIFRLFRVFSGTFLQTPKNTLFETFLGFRARWARRLL